MKKCVFWLDFENPSHADLKPLEKVFNIHHLAIEDCLSPQENRSKLVEYDTFTHIVVYAVIDRKKLKLEQVNFIFGKNFIISIHKSPLPQFDAVKKNKQDMDVLMKQKPDGILHGLMDKLVDDFFPMFDELNEKLDRLEDNIIKKPDPKHITTLFRIKRETLGLKRILSAQRDALSSLTKSTNNHISKHVLVYFRDLHDHMIWLNDQIDTSREWIASVLDLHLSVTSNKMNEIMKVLTIIATIMLPLTVIGSIYGMNFKYMPELQWRYGYLMVWLVMILITIGMLYYFRRKGWL